MGEEGGLAKVGTASPRFANNDIWRREKEQKEGHDKEISTTMGIIIILAGFARATGGSGEY